VPCATTRCRHLPPFQLGRDSVERIAIVPQLTNERRELPSPGPKNVGMNLEERQLLSNGLLLSGLGFWGLYS
jgi:hypothetical protein